MSDTLSEMQEALQQIQLDFEAEAKQAGLNALALENLRVAYLGKKGSLTLLLRGMGKLDAAQRPLMGQAANDIRQTLEAELNGYITQARHAEQEIRLEAEAIDVTLPGQVTPLGCRHPLTQVIDQITRIFTGMGYAVAAGPEVEYTRYNFDLLHIPEGHPSRDVTDTFYITDDIILRTQTSPVQVRVMRQQQPPIKIICPGMVYRPDTPDATHSPVFHQIEGLAVDRGITMGDLAGTLQLYARQLFGADTKIRLRPHHFPFTEPSCEVDVSCWNCGGAGCPTCKGEGYVEILGAGMVHPWVLEQNGIDPHEYSGFAFGIGVERTAMARYKIDDIRNLYSNNLQFLEQFK